MNDREFKAELKQGLSGIYLFYGDEEFLKKYYLAEGKKHVLGEDDDFAVFNYVEIQEEEFSPDALRDAAATVPMMAEKVCVVAHADLTKYADKKANAVSGKLEDLTEALSQIRDADTSVVFIVCASGNFDAGRKNRPSALLKTVQNYASVVEFEYQSSAVLKKWALRHFEREQLSANDDALSYIVSAAGPDMTFLSLEIQKLVCYVKSQNRAVLTLEDAALLCSENGELDDFALSNAIVSGDRAAALEALREAQDKRRKATVVLSGITSDFINMLTVSIYVKEGLSKDEIARKTGLHAFRVGKYMEAVRNVDTAAVRAALDRCREADAALKGSGIDYIALERLVCVMPARRQYTKY